MVTINHGSLSFSTQNVADRYSKGAIYVYTITAPVIDDKGLTSHVKLILTVKVAQDPQLDFAYDTLSEKDMAIARAFLYSCNYIWFICNGRCRTFTYW